MAYAEHIDGDATATNLLLRSDARPPTQQDILDAEADLNAAYQARLHNTFSNKSTSRGLPASSLAYRDKADHSASIMEGKSYKHQKDTDQLKKIYTSYMQRTVGARKHTMNQKFSRTKAKVNVGEKNATMRSPAEDKIKMWAKSGRGSKPGFGGKQQSPS